MVQQNTPEQSARRLNWNLLKVFLVLAQSKSITDAADKLFLKQPTVSHALKQLEDHFGKQLIKRTSRTFKLTTAGKALYQEVIEINGTVLRFNTLMRDVVEQVTGHTRIALASHVVCPLFNDALSAYHVKHPRATLSIDVSSSHDAETAVSLSQVSMAICLVHKQNPKMKYRRVYREFFGLFCGPDHLFFGRENLVSTDLAGQPSVSFITDQMSDALRSVAIMRAQANLDERIVARSSHLEEVRRLIIAGVGIGPLPLHVVKRDVDDGLLWRLPPYHNPPAIDVYLVWNPKVRTNRAEQAMLDEIIRRLDKTPFKDRTYA